MGSGRTFDDFKNQTSGWFVDIDGSKSGPFFLEQIMSMVQSGKIAPHHRITALHLKGEWITLAELMGSKKAPTAPFQPPPRPDSIETPALAESRPEDPAVSLFDALRVVKEKKQPPAARVRFRKDGITLSDWLAKNPWAPVTFLTAVVIIGLIWGMIVFMKRAPIAVRQAVPVMVPPVSSPVATPPPVRPAAPAPAHPGFTIEPAGHLPPSGHRQPPQAPREEPARDEPRRDDVPENHIDDSASPQEGDAVPPPAVNPDTGQPEPSLNLPGTPPAGSAVPPAAVNPPQEQ